MGYRESLAQIEGNLTDYYTRDISSARQMQSSTDHRATINKLAADIKVGKGGRVEEWDTNGSGIHRKLKIISKGRPVMYEQIDIFKHSYATNSNDVEREGEGGYTAERNRGMSERERERERVQISDRSISTRRN